MYRDDEVYSRSSNSFDNVRICIRHLMQPSLTYSSNRLEKGNQSEKSISQRWKNNIFPAILHPSLVLYLYVALSPAITSVSFAQSRFQIYRKTFELLFDSDSGIRKDKQQMLVANRLRSISIEILSRFVHLFSDQILWRPRAKIPEINHRESVGKLLETVTSEWEKNKNEIAEAFCRLIGALKRNCFNRFSMRFRRNTLAAVSATGLHSNSLFLRDTPSKCAN